ncbi:hypothetical protein [Burkholderia cenocepacia]|uniref:hypothetical protein n=1 Tax=Burkholderia cenocepacia TaxID=95486 RepID=UPI00192C2C21|nr:hypothetical protein [Burkholderia cenocepacia]
MEIVGVPLPRAVDRPRLRNQPVAPGAKHALAPAGFVRHKYRRRKRENPEIRRRAMTFFCIPTQPHD